MLNEDNLHSLLHSIISELEISPSEYTNLCKSLDRAFYKGVYTVKLCDICVRKCDCKLYLDNLPDNRPCEEFTHV